MRLGGVGLKEAERVRGWSGMGGGKKFWGTFFCGLVLILGGLRTPARGAEPGLFKLYRLKVSAVLKDIF